MKSLIAGILLILSSTAFGSCNDLYFGGKKINVANTRELCNSFYVVAYSDRYKGPAVSFERFQAGHDTAERNNTFRADNRIPSNIRANLGDYLNSGWDRGHMTPAGDASTDMEMRDTFLLSNMTPQSPKLNRGNWKALEERVRKSSVGVTYVATIALYGPGTLGYHKIGIPSKYYKVVWSNNKVKAYSADNKDSASVQEVSIDEVSSKTGIKLPTK